MQRAVNSDSAAPPASPAEDKVSETTDLMEKGKPAAADTAPREQMKPAENSQVQVRRHTIISVEGLFRLLSRLAFCAVGAPVTLPL